MHAILTPCFLPKTKRPACPGTVDTGKPVVALSRTAHDCLTDAQQARMSRYGRLLPIEIGTIERIGGGGVRCMLAEVFLPPANLERPA